MCHNVIAPPPPLAKGKCEQNGVSESESESGKRAVGACVRACECIDAG